MIEVFEDRLLLAATLTASLDGGGNLVIQDTADVGNALTLQTVNGATEVEITDANEQFAASSIFGAMLSNGDKTITIPLTSITGTAITLQAAGGADTVNVGSFDAEFDLNIAAESITTSGAIAVGARSISLTTDSLSIGDSLSGTGELKIVPQTASTTIGLGGGSGMLNLDDTELGFLVDGFSMITIGDAATGTGAVDIDSSMFADSLTIVGGSIDVTELNVSSNAVTLTARTGSITDGGSGGADISGDTITLIVMSSGAEIGMPGPVGGPSDPLEVVAFSLLNATTADGNMALESVNPFGPLPLGVLNAGAAMILLTANGPIIDGNFGVGAANLTAAGGVNLTTKSGFFGSPIGTLAFPIRTAIGSLTAITHDGGIFVSDSSAPGLILNNVLAKEGGNTPFLNGSNQVVVDANAPHAGIHDVNITALGPILLNSVTAPDEVTLNSATGTILDLNQAALDILARTVNLVADGAIGQQADSLELTAESFSASTTDGGIFLAARAVSTAASVTAGGPGNDVSVTSSASTLRIGSITAQGDVTAQNDGGSLVDANGAALNITGQNVALTGKSGIGTAGDPLETAAVELAVTASDLAAMIFVNESDGLASINAKTKDGNVTVNFSGGSLTFTASTDVLSASGAAVTFETTAGGIALGVVDAGSNDVSITAFGAIRDDVNDSAVDLRGGTVTLKAGTGIGMSGNQIDTDVATLTATTSAGDVHIREADALTLSVLGSASNIDVRTATGDLNLMSASASGQVTLHAGGAILDGNATAGNVSANTLQFMAANGIGTASDSLETTVNSVSADGGSGGGLFLSNSKALVLTSATATGGSVSVSAIGNLTIGPVTATGQAVTLNATGAIVDSNGAAPNVTATSLTVSGSSLGASGDKLETDVGTITASTSSGGVFLSNLGTASLTLTATALGSGSDIDIDSAGNMVLKTVTAQGDLVKLRAAGAILDGNDTPTTTPVNIIAKTLDMAAPGGLGTPTNQLEVQVDQVVGADGGAGGGSVSNAGPLAITEEALEAAGSGELTFDAESITILDIADNTATVAAGRSVILRTQKGNIVFLDAADTIETQGSGSITVQAGMVAGSGAVAVLGNLKTAGGPILVTADRDITIGLLDAGTGSVTVQALAGVIVDGNGASLNVISGMATISGATPTVRQAELHEINKIADAAGTRGEAAAKQTSSDAFEAGSVILVAAQIVADNAVTNAENDVAAKQAIFDPLDAESTTLEITLQVLSGVSFGLDVTVTVVGTIAAVAQAVPFTGDGGSATAAFAVQVVKNVVDATILGVSIAKDQVDGNREEALIELTEAKATQGAAESTAMLAEAAANAFEEAFSIAKAAAEKAAIARDAAARVSAQATLARDQANVFGTAAQPLGIQATGPINITAGTSDVFLQVVGSTTLGNISTTGANRNVQVSTDGDVTIQGMISTSEQVRIDTSNGAIVNGGGTITAPKFVATATAGVGTSGGLATKVGKLAVSGGTGGVNISNTGNLEVTTIDGVVGASATAGGVTISVASDLTLISLVNAPGQTVSLSAGTGSIIDGNGTANNVVADKLALNSVSGIASSADVLETTVSSLAANGGTGGVFVTNTGNLVLEAVDTVNSMTATGGRIEIVNVGSIQIANGIVQGTGLTVNLTATGGSITETSAGAAADIVGETINLIVTGTMSTVGSSSETLEIDAVTLNVTTAGGSIFLEDTSSGVAVGLVTAGTGDVTLTASNGNITESATTDTDPDILGSTINLTTTGSGTVGTSSRTLVINAVTLNTMTAGGSVFLEDAMSGVAVGLVTAGTGDVNLLATGGSITESATTDGAADIVGTTINLIVTGPSSTVGTSSETLEIDAVTLNVMTAGGSVFLEDTTGGVAVGLVTAGTGDVNLKATGGSITESATTDTAADIVGTTINLIVTGGSSTVGTSSETLEINAVTLNVMTDAGSIFLEDTTGGVAVGLVTAGIGDVNLKATGGSMTESATTDVAADIVGSTLNLIVTGVSSTVGTSSETLEINAVTLNVMTDGGSVFLEDTTGGVAIGLVTAGTGDVNLKATAGSMTESATTDAAADIVGATINLLVTGVASTVGTSSETLEINAVTLNVMTDGGSVFLEDTTGGVAVGLVTAGTGDVNLLATGGSITESATTDAAADIVGTTINLIVTGITSTVGTSIETLEINAVTLNVMTDGGSIFLEDTTGGVAVGLVTAVTGDVNLRATGGSMTESATTDAAADIVGSTINLIVTGATSTVGTSSETLEIDAGTLNVMTDGGSVFVEDTTGGVAVGLVTAGIGDVNLLVTDGSLTESATTDAAADIVGSTLNLVVTGVASTVGTFSETLEINAVTLNVTTDGGSVFLEDTTGGVAVGLVTAGIGDVTLTATGGSITEATGTDGVADIVGSTINLTVTGGAVSTVGTSIETLEINAVTLNVTTDGGSVFLEDTTGGVAAGLITAGIGDVTLTATGGSMTESATTDAAADIVGATVNLIVTGIASTVGTSSETLEIDAVTLNVMTAGGSVFLNDTAGGVAVGLVDADIGDVTLSATGAITDGNGTSTNINAVTLTLSAAGGIGSTDALETEVSTLNATNTTGGNLQIANNGQSSGLLDITGLSNSGGGDITITNIGAITVTGAVSATGAGADVSITAASPVTVSANVIADGSVTIEAGESPGTGDDLLVDNGVTVQSTGSSVTLRAGDNVTLQLGTTVCASAILSIVGDYGNNDPAGTLIILDGVVCGSSITVAGNTNDDVFSINPSMTANVFTLSVDGSGGTDRLGVNSQNAGDPFTLTGSTIQWSIGATQKGNVQYSGIEKFVIQGGAAVTTVSSTDPALQIVNGIVSASGLTLTATAGGVGVLIQGGSLTLRNSSVTSVAGQPGILVFGGIVNLGTINPNSLGGNTFGGPGLFIVNQTATDISAFGNIWGTATGPLPGNASLDFFNPGVPLNLGLLPSLEANIIDKRDVPALGLVSFLTHVIILQIPSPSKVYVVQDAGNLRVRLNNRFGPDLITPVPISVVRLLQLEGGGSKEEVILEASLLGTFTGSFTYNGYDGNDVLDVSAIRGTGSFGTTFNGGLGNDVAKGGDGADTFNGGGGNDSLYGNIGNDDLRGGDGADLIYGGAGNDCVHGDNDNDKLFGDAGLDTLKGGLGNDNMDGGTDNDAMFGGDGNDSLLGKAGNDVITGQGGNDTIKGDIGNDTLGGGDGNDKLEGGAGNDSVMGEAGDDTLAGNNGTDSLSGGSGSNSLIGAGAPDIVGAFTFDFEALMNDCV